MARKFYIQNSLTKNSIVTIDGDEFLHITKVLRKKVGDKICLINDSGNDYTAEIIDIAKNNLQIKIVDESISKTETTNNVTVFQALVKADKFELITQKLTELGVKSIVPFYSSFCQVKPNTTRLDRLEKISIEALKQCGRSKKVEIENVITFDQMRQSLSKFDIVLFAYENSCIDLKKELIQSNENKSQNIAIIIGSEGGFSEEENNQLLALKNVKQVSLGNRILRAETASVALTSVVMFLLGEWNK